MDYIYIFIAMLIGLLIGVILSFAVTKKRYHNMLCGYLRIDSSDPYEPPYLFVELTDDVEQLVNRNSVIFEVRK